MFRPKTDSVQIKYLRVPDEIIEVVKEQQVKDQAQRGGRGGMHSRGDHRGDRGGRGTRGRGRGRGRRRWQQQQQQQRVSWAKRREIEYGSIRRAPTSTTVYFFAYGAPKEVLRSPYMFDT